MVHTGADAGRTAVELTAAEGVFAFSPMAGPARLLLVLLAALHGAHSFLSEEGEVNAAKFYDAVAKSKAGQALGAAGIFDDLKAQEDSFYRLANDPMQYDPKKQIEAIRAFTRKAGPLLGLEDGHGPLHEMLHAARAVLGMAARAEGEEQPHPWVEAKKITPLCAEFLTRTIKAHKRRMKRAGKEEL